MVLTHEKINKTIIKLLNNPKGYKVFLEWKDGRLSSINPKGWENDYKPKHLIKAKGHRIWFFEKEIEAKEYLEFLERILESHYKSAGAKLVIKPIKYSKDNMSQERYFIMEGNLSSVTRHILNNETNAFCYSVPEIIME